MLPIKLRLSGALKPKRRLLGATVVGASLLVHNIHHPLLSMLPTKLRLAGALQCKRRVFWAYPAWGHRVRFTSAIPFSHYQMRNYALWWHWEPELGAQVHTRSVHHTVFFYRAGDLL